MEQARKETQKYRKTALIEATQWFKIGDHPAVAMKDDVTEETLRTGVAVPWVSTLEGGHIVSPGDWIATGVQGEHWPIKPDVFAATYEAVSTQPDKLAVRREALEEAKAVADDLVKVALRMSQHSDPLPIDTNEAWRRVMDGALDTSEAIRALIERPGHE